MNERGAADIDKLREEKDPKYALRWKTWGFKVMLTHFGVIYPGLKPPAFYAQALFRCYHVERSDNAY